MRPPLLIALALALAATFWLQQSEDPGSVEVAQRRAPDRARAADPSGSPGRTDRSVAPAGPVGPVGQSAQGAASPAARAGTQAPPDATGAWLVERVQAWQAQRAEAQTLPPARVMSAAAPSGWAAALPPAPPPPRASRAEEAAPVAPPFPHQWVGRFDDEASGGTKALRRAVISGAVSTWVAREGDVIEGQWRIDQIQERHMRLTYLPLQQSQTVAMK